MKMEMVEDFCTICGNDYITEKDTEYGVCPTCELNHNGDMPGFRD